MKDCPEGVDEARMAGWRRQWIPDESIGLAFIHGILIRKSSKEPS
jgi:hypothetical protein